MDRFKKGEHIIYKNGDRLEVGKIKSLKGHGAFVWYHSGETAALTNYEDMIPIANEPFMHCLGGNKNE